MHNNTDEFGVSVICPTYNASNYIQRTINSLLDQVEPASEIIFSDDGSTDDTFLILKNNKTKFLDLNIDIKLLNNKHKGPGAARNAAIIESTQKWIAFLDADDTWKNEKLFLIKNSIKNNKEINFVVHWEEYIRFNNKSSILNHGNINNHNSSIPKELFKRNIFSTSAIVCKKINLINAGLFDITLPNGQDYDLWLKMSPDIKLKVIPKVLGVYYEEEGSITSRPYYQRVVSELRILWKHKNKGNVKLFLFKFFKIIISKQWYFSLRNVILKNKSHSY
jgi:teichuronic acid biosynthesis glycosyltransferase TuaG